MVLVVAVGIVRVPVGHSPMSMAVSVSCAGCDGWLVGMVVVSVVVGVPVLVCEGLMGVFVLVAFGQVQPHPGGHEHPRHAELPGRRCAQCDGDRRTDERCYRVVGPGAGRPDVAKRDDEQHQADPVGQQGRPPSRRAARPRPAGSHPTPTRG